jgi:phosphonate transport system ATP-binding protein
MQAVTLELRDVTRRFGDKIAVDHLSLDIPPGQMVGVIGRSGAGKSTLLRLINRLQTPTSGSIHYGDTDVSALKGRALRDWRTRCAMIFQQFNLVPRLDVLTNVLLGRLNHRGTWPSLLGLFTAAERAMALQALERFDLSDVALVRADTISGGQMQRVAICRALLQEPRLMLADEPIASLDPHNAQVVMEALRGINRDDDITVLCNLHHLDTARTYCDRIVALQSGRIVFDGLPTELTKEKVRDIYGVTEAEFNAPRAAGGSLVAA